MSAADTGLVPLDLLDPAGVRRRALLALLAGVIIGAAIGGAIGLFAGAIPGVVAAVVVALPLVAMALGESRRRVWLLGSSVSARALGTRVVDLHALDSLDVLITDLRGTRTVGLLVGGAPRGKTINVALASYAGTGGRALGPLVLRRLADVFAGAADPQALVYSNLLVAQLRAEARGEAAPDRPLFQLASLAADGRLAQRLHFNTVTQFVAALD